MIKFLDNYTVILLCALAILPGCSISENEIEPEQSYARIYNDESFESNFEPLDVIQTADSGFLVLGYYDINKTYLLRADRTGHFQWDMKLEENFVNPIPGLFQHENRYHFFCMDDLTLETYIMHVNVDAGEASVVKSFPEVIYPLYASRTDDDGMLILSYERNTLSSKLTKVNTALDVEWDNEYPVIEDVEEEIIGHVAGTGQRLPFFTGSAEGKYFFNGYSNFSFSLHFVNGSNGDQTGVINGFRDSGAISSAIHLNGSEYALTRYSFGENYILSKSGLEENSVSFSSDLPGNPHPEIRDDAQVTMEKILVEEMETLLLTTTTKSGQIIIYLFNTSDGSLMGSKRIGFTNPYNAVKAVQTLDNGVAILGNTFVTGRFSRIFLYKLSEDELIDIAK